MTSDDQQPSETTEPEPEPASGDADREPDTGADPGISTDESADNSDDPDEEASAFQTLPVSEQVRRLRAQFEDLDWRTRPRRLTIRRTIEEDPAGYPYLSIGFPGAARGERALERSWAHAEAALDATKLGRLTGATLELLAAGHEFRVVMHIPELGGAVLLTKRGWRTPNGAMRNSERAFVRLVIEENAPVLAARQTAETPAENDDRTTQDVDSPNHG